MSANHRPPRVEALCDMGAGCDHCPGNLGNDSGGCARDETLNGLIWAVLDVADAVRDLRAVLERMPTPTHDAAPAVRAATKEVF